MEKNQQKTKQKIKEDNNISYESLQPFPPTTNYVQLMRDIINTMTETPETEWNKHVSSINSLRILKKYQPKLLYTIIYDMDIQSVLSKYISSIRSSVAIPTLMLIKEIFSEYEFEYDEENKPIELVYIVKHFLPDLINKSLSEKSFIKESAKNCLDACSKNMLYGETMITLLKECCNEKNAKTVDVAYDTLMNLIENFDKNYLINYDNWKEIFEELAKIWNLKKDIYIKYPGKIVEQFKKKITSEEYDKIFMEKCTDKKEKEDILAAVEYANGKTTKENKKKEIINIKQLIKQDKMKNENNEGNGKVDFEFVSNDNKELSKVE